MPTVPAAYTEMIEAHMRKMGQDPNAGTARKPMGEIPFPEEKKPGKKEFLDGSFKLPGTWVIPVWLESESNAGGKMRAAISRKATVKNAIWRALGPHWRIWGPIGDRIRTGQNSCVPRSYTGFPYPKIVVTRVGGRGLDIGNLWRACKPVEDALGILLGCDDGWFAWKECFSVEQEPGPLWAVRIEMTLPVPSGTGPEVR